MTFLSGVRVIGSLVGNCVSSFPLSFKVHGSLVPIFNSGVDRIHSIDSFHEGNRDASLEEVNEGIFLVISLRATWFLNWEM